MSRVISPVTGKPYGLAAVCRAWRLARSGVYRHQRTMLQPQRRGPLGAMSDDGLTAAIQGVLAASPFHGEGHRKVWARLRYAGIRTSLRRVLRLMTWSHCWRAISASSWAKAVAIKAATTRRPCFLAWARTLRMKCTRQRCQEACRTLATAALSPSCASEITSLTPLRPRLASERRNSVQPFDKLRSLGLGGADCDAQHLASAIAVDGDGNDHRDRDDATGGANLEVGRVQPEIG